MIVDLSENNGKAEFDNLIDWDLASQRVKYAILRATMGATGVDASFVYNVENAIRCKVGIGAYHFFRPESRGVVQAQHFIQAVKAYPFDFYDVDVEPPSNGASTTPAAYADELLNFIEEFKWAVGEYPTIYTNFESWRTLVGTQHDETFAKCKLHVANYTNTPQPLLPRCWDTYQLWQYSSSGMIPGISKTWSGSKLTYVWGRVDMNRIPTLTPLRTVLPADPPFKVTQRYGANPEYYAQFGLPGHEGLDGYGSTDKIYSVADGVVKLIFKDNQVHPYGNHVRITHSGGYESIYAHLRGFKDGLVNGSPVEAGQLIGFMGNTGNVITTGGSSGIHLHLSIKLNGKVIDPETIIKFN